jgi:Cu(I)/Ag(I) efflux system membrane protein CusA/SilA
MNVSWTVEGLERYPINVRYPRELRSNVEKLGEVLVPTPTGARVPLSQVAIIRIHQGPPAIKSENARPNAWVYVDLTTSDLGGWVERAKKAVAEQVELPAGYTLFWSGQYEYMQRAKARLLVIVPITLFLIFLILYINTKSLIKTAIVLLAVPFSIVGAVWFLHLLGYHWSIAVWVGLIALAGLDAETGVVMLLYLDIAYKRWTSDGRMRTYRHLSEAVEHGAVQRIRPKMMTVTTTFLALVPIMWASGTGADVMRRIAAPMVGGIFTSFLGELMVYPAIYFIWRSLKLKAGPLFPEKRPASTSGLEAPRRS